jgi:hypothetical protein
MEALLWHSEMVEKPQQQKISQDSYRGLWLN